MKNSRALLCVLRSPCGVGDRWNCELPRFKKYCGVRAIDTHARATSDLAGSTRPRRPANLSTVNQHCSQPTSSVVVLIVRPETRIATAQASQGVTGLHTSHIVQQKPCCAAPHIRFSPNMMPCNGSGNGGARTWGDFTLQLRTAVREKDGWGRRLSAYPTSFAVTDAEQIKSGLSTPSY